MDGSMMAALARQGISRRAFLRYCAMLATLMALPPSAGRAMAASLAAAPTLAGAARPAVIWLPFQECTGCTESITRSHSPSIEGLIFAGISLDYQETLMAAAGQQAEAALHTSMAANAGKYLLVVDGSIPLYLGGAYSCSAGRSSLDLLKEAGSGAAAIIALGSCAAFGGLPQARPNPTGAVSVALAMKQLGNSVPIINLPGCPPIPVVITAILAHFLAFGSLPACDALGRPRAFYGDSIHDRCYRRPFYDQGKFAKSFDDEGARRGWCLFELGCKGPVTHNACATVKWNGGTSWPVESGHGCLGCAEPDFWDAGGFYQALSMPARPLHLGAKAAATGVAAGVAISLVHRNGKRAAAAAHETTTLTDLEGS